MVKICWNINGYESKTHNPQYVKRFFFVRLTLFKRKPTKRKDSLYTDSTEYTYYIYERQVLQKCP